MGLQIRDDRQMKALTGLSQTQFDHLLPVFSDIYRATQQHTYEEGVQAGTRRRHPGGGSKGKLPTMAEKLQFVLYSYRLPIQSWVFGANRLILLRLKMALAL
jgi:hypothetical protein